MDLVSQRLLQDEKSVNAMEVKETAKNPERIFDDLICQLLGEIPGGEIKDLAKIEVQQTLVKAKQKTKQKKKTKKKNKQNLGKCRMHPILTHSISHQHMVWYYPVNPIHCQFNLQRLTRSNARL